MKKFVYNVADDLGYLVLVNRPKCIAICNHKPKF